MSVAASVVSRSTVLLGPHAKLDQIASSQKMVKKTLGTGFKMATSASLGGFGAGGAWSFARCIGEEDLNAAFDDLGVHDVTAAAVLEDGLPLWHVVVQSMTNSSNVITAYLMLGGFEELREELKTLVREPFCELDLPVEDLHRAIFQLEPLLKCVYDGVKSDGKWKGQVAYMYVEAYDKVSLLNNFIMNKQDQADLVEALLQYTPQVLQARDDPRRLQMVQDHAGRCELSLPKRTGMASLAVGGRPLAPGDTVEFEVLDFGSSRDGLVVGVVGNASCTAGFLGDFPQSIGFLPGSLSIQPVPDPSTVEQTGWPPAEPDVQFKLQIGLDGRGRFVVRVGESSLSCPVPWQPTDDGLRVAVGLWSDGVRLRCSEEFEPREPSKPWLWLADAAYTFVRTPHRDIQASGFGNSAFHNAAWHGNAKCLEVLLRHAALHQIDVQGLLNMKGETPFKLATAQVQSKLSKRPGHEGCERLLLGLPVESTAEQLEEKICNFGRLTMFDSKGTLCFDEPLPDKGIVWNPELARQLDEVVLLHVAPFSLSIRDVTLDDSTEQGFYALLLWSKKNLCMGAAQRGRSAASAHGETCPPRCRSAPAGEPAVRLAGPSFVPAPRVGR